VTHTRDKSDPEEPTHFSIGGFTYDLSRGQLLNQQGELVKLRPKPRQVLEELLRFHGQPVKREELSDRIWGSVVVTEDALTQCIRDLRNVLGDTDRSVLKTLPKIGYVLHAIPRESVPNLRVSSALRGKLLFLAGCAVIASLVLLFTLTRKDSTHFVEARNPIVAIQQFESLVDDDRWRRLAFGLSLEVGSELANRKILTVHSVSEADQLKSGIGGFVLKGTLQADNSENLQVLAQLVDTENAHEIIWNQRWNRPLEEYFDIQSEIVSGITSTLSPFCSGKINQVIVNRAPENDRSLSAYELYLKGIEQKHRFTSDSYFKAEEYLLRALEIDPEFSEAWSTLAVVYLNLAINAETSSQKKSYTEKRASAATRAFELAPENPDTLVQWSWYNAHNGDWPQSEAAMRKAVLHAGNDSDVLGVAALAGSQYVPLGNDAVEWVTRAIELRSPYPLWYNLSAGIASFHVENFQQARSYLIQAPDMVQRHLYLAATLQKLNDIAGATESREALKRIRPNFTIEGYAKSVAMGPTLKKRIVNLGREAGIPAESGDSWRNP